MNAAETIAAAIQKLEEVRTTPVPPTVHHAFLAWAQRSPAGAAAATYIVRITSEEGVDAQLAVLRQGLPYAKSDCLFDDAFELQLARAILGVTS
jgi:hypothetical protein